MEEMAVVIGALALWGIVGWRAWATARHVAYEAEQRLTVLHQQLTLAYALGGMSTEADAAFEAFIARLDERAPHQEPAS